MAVGFTSLLGKDLGGAGIEPSAVGFASLFAKNLSGGGGGIATYILSANVGAYIYHGEDALVDLQINAAQGSYALTGQAVSLRYGRRLAASPGSYLLSGQNVTLNKTGNFLLQADQRSYLVAGQNVNLTYGKILTAAAGSYAITGISAEFSSTEVIEPSEGISDYGIHFTQPWEGCMGETPGEVIKMKFPANFGTMKFIAYDNSPIDAHTKKAVQSGDPSYITKEGTPVAYYPYDEVNDGYVLYPRPTVNFSNELSGDGLAFFADGDTEDAQTGFVGVRVGSSDSSPGASYDIVDADDSVFMVYSVSPEDIETTQDDTNYPEHLKKYIRYGVAALAYGANTDGRIPTLSEYWKQRYELGLGHIKRYQRKRRQDRDYRLTTRGTPGRRSYRHPRLPDGYPNV